MLSPLSSHNSNIAPLHQKSSPNLTWWLRIALMVSLLSVSSWIAIPLPFSPVPLTLQTVIVLMIPFVLDTPGAITAVFIYLLMGALGLPVFAKLQSGVHYMVGPTGGYLVGFFFAMPVMGFFAKKNTSLSILIGLFTIYAFGMTYLHFWVGQTVSQTILQGFVVFFPLDVFKAIWVRWLISKYRKVLSMENNLNKE